MEKGNYEVGQPVWVDLPGTYGKVIEVVPTGSSSSTYSKHKSIQVIFQPCYYNNITNKPVIVIEYMEPQNTMMGRVTKSIYKLEYPFWANAIHIINPEEELKRLEQEKGKGKISELNLEKIVQYLRSFQMSVKIS